VLHDKNDQVIERAVHVSDVSLASLELGPYSHFMQKEIHEQPKALSDTIEAVLENGFAAGLFGARAAELLPQVEGVKILACGTSYYAGLTAKYWIESIAGISCDVEIASEYRYRAPLPTPSTWWSPSPSPAKPWTPWRR
jgi:glucosamine--fructose-6-phosphate aminotransferase (isomerizing)